ncbi:MAG: alkyl hydroperoxide reductase, partial [Chloroflexi bacterium]|nr:alkyl hydroperoxide reductase [Chloroflexota bacterium]
MRKLERRYADTLQIVSVHSPKFPTERETENLRQAILRLRIEHPVLNDADFKYWQTFGARAWPTLYFIDPRGNVIGIHEGELTEDMAAPLIEGWLVEYEAEQILTRKDLGLVRETGRDSALSFPGKVAWDDSSGRLVVSDSNNDRIVVSDIDGNVSQVIGGSEAGFTDGSASEARFNQPQGVEVFGDYVFVADNENHALRRLH